MHDLGESFQQKDEIGAGIERIVRYKHADQDKAKLREEVANQLKQASKQLSQATSKVHSSNPQPEVLGLLEESETLSSDPCQATSAADASGCNKPKIKKTDKHGYLLPKKLTPPEAPNDANALAAALKAAARSAPNPFAANSSNSSAPPLNPNATKFSQAEIDAEVSAIKTAALSPEDEAKAQPKVVKFAKVKPASTESEGPPPVSGPPRNASKPASTKIKPFTPAN